jgi:hypothetical protein
MKVTLPGSIKQSRKLAKTKTKGSSSNDKCILSAKNSIIFFNFYFLYSGLTKTPLIDCFSAT